MSLIEHAKQELELIGYRSTGNSSNAKDEINDWMFNNIMEIVETFSKQGHSGGSFGYTVSVISKLLRYENLSPLKLDDFVEVAPDVFQCKRNPAMFLNKNKTGYYCVNSSKEYEFLFNQENNNEKTN